MSQLLTIAAIGILGVSWSHAQTSGAHPEFEAASIKANTSASAGSYKLYVR
jgi:hypothetical protein